MTISLPPDLEQRLQAEVDAGRAKSVESLVHDAVRAHLFNQDDFLRSLDEAEAEFDAEGGIPWEDVRARIDARLARDD